MTSGAKPSVLRCGRCGRFVDWTEARLQIVCGCRPRVTLPPVLTRDAGPDDRAAALDLFRRDFGTTDVTVFGEVVSLEATRDLIVAETAHDIGGALAWRRRHQVLQVLALATDPMWQRSGVGGHLLAEAELVARRERLPRVLAAATNDNLPALYFYQRRGYRIVEVVAGTGHRPGGAATTGFADIPILDELHLEKGL